ncbi:MAG: acyl carrier protein [Pseudomonadota bacterium]
MTSLETKITAFIQDTFGVSIQSADEPLITNGVIDSMQVLDVAMFLETVGNTTLEETDLVVENFDTVAAMAALVSSKG